MSNESEVAFRITGATVQPPDRSGSRFGGTIAGLKQAIGAFASRCRTGKENQFAGSLYILMRNERDGQEYSAVISMTGDEVFLTVPVFAPKEG